MIAGSNSWSGGTTQAFYTINGGTSWAHVSLGNSGDPGVALDRAGNAYFSFISSAGGIGVRKPTTGGSTVTVANGSQDKPEITVGPDHADTSKDRVYVAWDDYGANDVLKVSSSTDGTTWTTPKTVDGRPNEIFAELAVSSNGTLYVAWIDFGTPSVARLKVSSSTNDGASFSTPVVAATSNVNPSSPTTYTIPAQPTRGIGAAPSLAIDRWTGTGHHSGRLYLTYTDAKSGAHNDTDVKLTYSDNGGTTWSTPITVHNVGTRTSQFFSWVAVDPTNGNVDIAWYDARNDRNNKKVDVYFARSTDGGVTFPTNTKVTDVQSDESNPFTDNANQYGDYMGVAAYGGKAFPVWCDTRNGIGNEEIYTVGAGGVAPATAPSSLSVQGGEAVSPADSSLALATTSRNANFLLANLSLGNAPSGSGDLLGTIPADLATSAGAVDSILDPMSVDHMISNSLFFATRQKHH
jgi:hypothetical protein